MTGEGEHPDHLTDGADRHEIRSATVQQDRPSLRERWRRRPDRILARRHLHWWVELLVIFTMYQVYTFVRNTFGSNGNSFGTSINPEAVAVALGHAHDVIGLERRLGLFFEPHVQQWYLGLPGNGGIRLWNIYYGSFHFVVPILVLVWLFRRFPEHYRYWRNALTLTTLLALIGFAGFSLMPPRLLAYPGAYGGCSLPQGFVLADPRLACHDFGIVDTMSVFGGLWNFGSAAMANISNQYAAMPSLHIGWSVWAALAVVPRVEKRWKKIAMVLYPIMTFFCIIVTGNHYWLDAVGALVALAVGSTLGFTLAHVTDERMRRREAALPRVTGVTDRPVDVAGS